MNTGILEYWNTGILEYGNTGIHEYGNTGIRKYGNTEIHRGRIGMIRFFSRRRDHERGNRNIAAG